MKVRLTDLMDHYYGNGIQPDPIEIPGQQKSANSVPAQRRRGRTPLLIAAALLLVVTAAAAVPFTLSKTVGHGAMNEGAASMESITNTLPPELPTEIPAAIADSSLESAQEASITESPVPEENPTDETVFYEVFWEVDRASLEAYLAAHPETLENGWANLDINESSPEQDGTGISTVYGDQVLALNAKDGVIIFRTTFPHPLGHTSRGTVAICKDVSRLDLCAAETLGTAGQTVGDICDASGGLLAITGSAFWDSDGNGNGGDLSGLMISRGQSYGTPLGGTYKRLELRSDNKMYVVDSAAPVGEGTRDACEFMPAVIVDGEIIRNSGWDAVQPRAILGQTSKLEPIMAIAEGRLNDSVGCGVEDVAEALAKYDCAQAMNLDGGTSAIMYYKGETITRCSNQNLPDGRALPSAWVYHPAQ